MKTVSLGRLRSENVRVSLIAREEYLQATFELIEQGHGGLTTYLAKCGVASCEIESLPKLLVE